MQEIDGILDSIIDNWANKGGAPPVYVGQIEMGSRMEWVDGESGLEVFLSRVCFGQFAEYGAQVVVSAGVIRP